eukprot:g56562.t1
MRQRKCSGLNGKSRNQRTTAVNEKEQTFFTTALLPSTRSMSEEQGGKKRQFMSGSFGVDAKAQQAFRQAWAASSSSTEMNEEEDISQRPKRSMTAHDSDDEKVALNPEEDDSFFHLLQGFAGLGLPDKPPGPESCPVCTLEFPMAEFAKHVYDCIKEFDDTEQKELEKISQKLAVKLGAGQPQDIEEVAHSDGGAGTECPQGRACRRVDMHHFKNR